MQPEFKTYSKQVVKNASVLAEVLMNEGLKLVSNGTDNHLILVDLRTFGTGRGYFVAKALDAANIYLNRNSVFDDPSSPFYPSGIRLGTPAVTSRGMKEAEMKQIGKWISEITKIFATTELPEDKSQRIQAIKDFAAKLPGHETIQRIGKEVTALASKFPVPGID